MRAAVVIVGLALALPVAALERASQGSLLKTAPPTRSGPPASPPPPGNAPMPPVVATPAIRLFGIAAKKDAGILPALVATSPLRLWGATSTGAVVNTAGLLLLGSGPAPAAAIHTTEPIRLWGGS